MRLGGANVRMVKKLRDLSISQKLIISFVVIIIIPLSISYFAAFQTANNLVLTQIMAETEGSLELVANI